VSNVQRGAQKTSFAQLKFDGTTCCGNWVFCGAYVGPTDDPLTPANQPGNRMAKRSYVGNTPIGIYPNWSWCWPVNRRIVYNRASVDLTGQPFDPDSAVITYDAVSASYIGDVSDGGGLPGAKYPFIMNAEGVGKLFASKAMADGPFPEHWEPVESPLGANPINGSLRSPYYFDYGTEWAPMGDPSKYPIVCTTYRLSEHWQTGSMTRSLTWLGEAQPCLFIEMSHELAEEIGIQGGEEVIVETARGSIKACSLVTHRFKPFTIAGKMVHQIGIPWHYGYAGLFTGPTANNLTPNVGDANTRIPEYKAFLCNVKKA